MKKYIKVDNFMNIIGILLVIGFVICLRADYYEYQNTINSAPFYVFIIGRSLVFLLPSIICFIVAVYMKKRH